MTSEGRSLLGDGGERHSPLPSDTSECALKFTDSSAASAEVTGNPGGLIFVTGKTESGEGERSSAQEGVVTLDSPPANPKLEEVWGKVERVMSARQWSVREVMEEFGVADAPPESDELEDELWKVVEGTLTLTEAADLV